MKPKFEWNFKKRKVLSGMPKKTQLLILLLFGILLLVIALPTSPSSSDDSTLNPLQSSPEDSDSSTSTSAAADEQAYESLMEDKVERVLSEVDGVGKVSVMLTLKSSTEQVIEKDSTSDSVASDEGSQNSSSKTSIYKQDSDGNQIPYVKKELTPQIEGVIVIADGGDNSVVVQNISEAMQALFGVEAHKIKIMKRESS